MRKEKIRKPSRLKKIKINKALKRRNQKKRKKGKIEKGCT